MGGSDIEHTDGRRAKRDTLVQWVIIMWCKGIFTRLTSLCLAMLTLSGCQLTGPDDFVELDLAVSDSITVPGNPIRIDVAVTNRGESTVHVRASGCPPWFEVTDGEGQPVARWDSVLCLAVALPPRELAPGESFGFSYDWGGDAPIGSGNTLEAGTYNLRGRLWGLSGRHAYTEPVSVRVASEGNP